jgi:phosphoglycerate dehydrogenase-like enzyme
VDRQSPTASPLKLALPTFFREQLEGCLPVDVTVSWFSDANECIAAVVDADVLWVGPGMWDGIDDVLRASTRLRWIHSHGAGTERHPLDLYRERGMIFTNGSGIAAIPIAEYVVLAMLAAAKRLPALIQAQERREWIRDPAGTTDLFGSNALIIGYGAIGKAIGDRLTPFGVNVTGVRRRPGGEPNVIGTDAWRSQLASFDWVVISVILNSDTRHLIGADEFARMRRSAWILNISRGAIVDQLALTEALKRGAIGGAYLDVTEPEPLPRESELWGLSNVIITPHSSWTSPNFDRRSAQLFLDLLEQFRMGLEMSNLVDLDAGYRVT